MAWPGRARLGTARPGEVFQARSLETRSEFLSGLGGAGPGGARPGEAWLGRVFKLVPWKRGAGFFRGEVGHGSLGRATARQGTEFLCTANLTNDLELKGWNSRSVGVKPVNTMAATINSNVITHQVERINSMSAIF